MNKRSITRIPIATIFADRTVTVEAITCGRFAVHSPGDRLIVRPGGASYTITHVATGHQAGRAWGIKNAQALARALDALLPPNEDFTTQDIATPFSARYATWLAQAKPILASVVKR